MNEASIHLQIVYTEACCIKHIICMYGEHKSNGSRQTSCRESVVSVKAMAREFDMHPIELGSR